MYKPDRSKRDVLDALKERAKELSCLYEVDSALSHLDEPIDVIANAVIAAIPNGWQYPEICCAKLVLNDKVFQPGCVETSWKLTAGIEVMGKNVGEISVFYSEERPSSDEGPFLKEERRLINTIADRLGLFVMQQQLRKAHDSWQSTLSEMSGGDHAESFVILEFLRRTDPKFLSRVTRKMIHEMCWRGVEGAPPLLQRFVSEGAEPETNDENRPLRKGRMEDTSNLWKTTFRLASQHLGEEEVVVYLQKWLEEDKSTYLIQTLENPERGLSEILAAVSRFENAGVSEAHLPLAVQKSLRVSLLGRLFSDSLSFLNVAKDFVRLSDFYEIARHIIHPAQSSGKLGGKGAGIFLAAQVLDKTPEYADLLKNVRTPKTWYVSSDTSLAFMHYNNLEDLYDRKYLEIERVRQEYQFVVQVFKNSAFPPEIVASLSSALDDFEDRPIIVRSSSLLEDRIGSAFSGKYKSLFLANQGPKKERLEALQDAIAEVYASVFAPDPIEYRSEKGLLDVHEEMGILIQEVVGRRIGKYFMPVFSGVAFSQNEFRWSPRIKREHGLLRMVPGLGTRAVDRLADDYPVLLSPGQPDLRVNVTADEAHRYSPKKMDVINLDNNVLETVEVRSIMREWGEEYPLSRKVVSIFAQDQIREPQGLEPDWEKDELVVTFQGLVRTTPFVEQMYALLNLLENRLGMPVDLEFACDGDDLYLLQCRAQSRSETYAPAPIPRDLPRENIVFSADRFISNGRVPEISHIVYVDADSYENLGDAKDLKDVGRVVGRLNKLLPKRKFVLIGPGRWGSRGDIRLGVPVTYSDISNTAVLLEVARKKGSYVSELSFGTHFFQDLVESDIRYIPLYPDEENVVFNELFLTRSKNILPEILPEYAHLAETVRVIDVPSETDGRILRVLMNADLDEAVGILSAPAVGQGVTLRDVFSVEALPETHWRWRLTMAERIAAQLDPVRFGVKALYVFGSAKNANAAPASDLDLIVHFDGSERQREDLRLWLDGWSRSLDETNFLRTGYRAGGLLDVHWVSDQDIENKTSFASKIDAVTDAARPLSIGTSLLS